MGDFTFGRGAGVKADFSRVYFQKVRLLLAAAFFFTKSFNSLNYHLARASNATQGQLVSLWQEVKRRQ